MRRRGSIIAGHIDREYRARKAYENRKRVNCKEKECNKCQYERICEDREK